MATQATIVISKDQLETINAIQSHFEEVTGFTTSLRGIASRAFEIGLAELAKKAGAK